MRRVFVVVWAFSSCDEQGLFFIAVYRCLIEAVSCVAEHRLQSESSVIVAHGFAYQGALPFKI